jgi:hypothetical protein
MRRYVVNLVDVEPSAVPPLEVSYEPAPAQVVDRSPATLSPPPAAPYQAITESWFDQTDDLADIAELFSSPAAAAAVQDSLRATGVTVFDYLVKYKVNNDSPCPPSGQRSPGIKAIHLIQWPAGVSAEAADRAWDFHASNASRYHPGLSRYVRNIVTRTLTPGAPPFNAIGELYFAQDQLVNLRVFKSAQERSAVEAEIGDFVGPIVADLVPAARLAHFLQAFRLVGTCPGAVSPGWLPRLIGARALELKLLYVTEVGSAPNYSPVKNPEAEIQAQASSTQGITATSRDR